MAPSECLKFCIALVVLLIVLASQTGAEQPKEAAKTNLPASTSRLINFRHLSDKYHGGARSLKAVGPVGTSTSIYPQRPLFNSARLFSVVPSGIQRMKRSADHQEEEDDDDKDDDCCCKCCKDKQKKKQKAKPTTTLKPQPVADVEDEPEDDSPQTSSQPIELEGKLDPKLDSIHLPKLSVESDPNFVPDMELEASPVSAKIETTVSPSKQKLTVRPTITANSGKKKPKDTKLGLELDPTQIEGVELETAPNQGDGGLEIELKPKETSGIQSNLPSSGQLELDMQPKDATLTLDPKLPQLEGSIEQPSGSSSAELQTPGGEMQVSTGGSESDPKGDQNDENEVGAGPSPPPKSASSSSPQGDSASDSDSDSDESTSSSDDDDTAELSAILPDAPTKVDEISPKVSANIGFDEGQPQFKASLEGKGEINVKLPRIENPFDKLIKKASTTLQPALGFSSPMKIDMPPPPKMIHTTFQPALSLAGQPQVTLQPQPARMKLTTLHPATLKLSGPSMSNSGTLYPQVIAHPVRPQAVQMTLSPSNRVPMQLPSVSAEIRPAGMASTTSNDDDDDEEEEESDDFEDIHDGDDEPDDTDDTAASSSETEPTQSDESEEPSEPAEPAEPADSSYSGEEDVKQATVSKQCKVKIRAQLKALKELTRLLEKSAKQELMAGKRRISPSIADLLSQQVDQVRASAEQAKVAASESDVKQLLLASRKTGLDLIRLAANRVASSYLDPAISRQVAPKLRRAHENVKLACQSSL